jgi:hypothetical protein
MLLGLSSPTPEPVTTPGSSSVSTVVASMPQIEAPTNSPSSVEVAGSANPDAKSGNLTPGCGPTSGLAETTASSAESQDQTTEKLVANFFDAALSLIAVRRSIETEIWRIDTTLEYFGVISSPSSEGNTITAKRARIRLK